MKKILDFFDYIAYRMHKFVIAHPRMIVPDAAPFIFSLVFFMPLMLIIVPICRAFNLSVHRYSGTWTILMAILVLLEVPIVKRYEKLENQKKFEERWENEDSKQRTRRGWLIWILIINNLILITALVVLLEHYNIL